MFPTSNIIMGAMKTRVCPIVTMCLFICAHLRIWLRPRKDRSSSIPPFLLKTADNPEGVDASVFEGIQRAVAADRYVFFTEFFKNFHNTDLLLGKRASEQAVPASGKIAAGASATASLACVPTWHEDFRHDPTRVDAPTLVIQGDADRILPITASRLQTGRLIKGPRLVVVKDGPHCITWTHAEQVNGELLEFLGKDK